jgi:hypothetical protein
MGSKHNTIGSLLQIVAHCIVPVLRQVVITTCVAYLSASTLFLHHIIVTVQRLKITSSPSTKVIEFRLDTLRLRLPEPWSMCFGAQEQSRQLNQESLRPTASPFVRPQCHCPTRGTSCSYAKSQTQSVPRSSQIYDPCSWYEPIALPSSRIMASAPDEWSMSELQLQTHSDGLM